MLDFRIKDAIADIKVIPPANDTLRLPVINSMAASGVYLWYFIR